MKKINDEMLDNVNGGIEEIHVTIKELDGEIEEYMIPLHNNFPDPSTRTTLP